MTKKHRTVLGMGIAGILAAASMTSADVIVGNFSAGIGTGTAFGTGASTIYKTSGWTMPAADYMLDDVVLTMSFNAGAEGIVSIWEGSGMPTTRLMDLEGPPQIGSGDFTFVPPQPLLMEAGKTYWLYVESIPNPIAQFLWQGTSPSTLPTGLATSTGFIFNGNASTFYNRFEVRGTPANGCYADCDGNQTLNIDDFLCFINAFAGQDPYADCDGNQVFNIDDFLCFIDEFAQGCP